MKSENKQTRHRTPSRNARRRRTSKNSGASRGEIDELLMKKLSDVLSEKQKKNKIKNLHYSLAKKIIINLNEKRQWVLM